MKCILLGYSNGVGKTSGKPYYRIDLGKPNPNLEGHYTAVACFTDATTFQPVLAHKPLDTVDADLRWVRGADFLFGLK